MNPIDTSALEQAAQESTDLLKSHIKEHQRRSQSGAVSTVKEHDDSRHAAMAASRAADGAHRRSDFESPDDRKKAAQLHHDAGMKHLAASEEAFNAGKSEQGKNGFYRASSHLGTAHAISTYNRKGQEAEVANDSSNRAMALSKLADKAEVKDHYDSLDRASGLHLLAMEHHQRAAEDHKHAANRVFNDDEKASDKHMKIAKQHQAKAEEHGKKVQEISGKAIKATDKARTLGEHAKTAEDHIAAARAHADAAKLDYDREGRAEHLKAAKWHAGQAKKAMGKEGKAKSAGTKEKEPEGKGGEKTEGKKTSAQDVLEQAGLKHSPGQGYKPELDPYQHHKGNVEHKKIHEALKAAGYHYTNKGKNHGGPKGETEWHSYDRSARGVDDKITLHGEGTKITRATRYAGPQRD